MARELKIDVCPTCMILGPVPCQVCGSEPFDGPVLPLDHLRYAEEGWVPWKGVYKEGREMPEDLKLTDRVLVLRRNGQVDGPWPVDKLVWRYRFDQDDIIGYQKEG